MRMRALLLTAILVGGFLWFTNRNTGYLERLVGRNDAGVGLSTPQIARGASAVVAQPFVQNVKDNAATVRWAIDASEDAVVEIEGPDGFAWSTTVSPSEFVASGRVQSSCHGERCSQLARLADSLMRTVGSSSSEIGYAGLD